MTWWKLAHYLKGLLPDFAGCTVVCIERARSVVKCSSSFSTVSVIPNAIDFNDYDLEYANPVRDTLIYSGSLTYHANFDAVFYF